MAKRDIPEKISLTKINYFNKKLEFIVREYEIHWSTKKGSYKNDENKVCYISIDEAIYYNNFSKLVKILTIINNIFEGNILFQDFWIIKMNLISEYKHEFFPKEDLKSKSLEFNWFIAKIASSRMVFLNNLNSLLENIYLFSNAELFSSHSFKKNLIIDSYSTIESFVVSINTIYTSLNKKGPELAKYDQRLNKIVEFDEFKNNESLKQEFTEKFKDNYNKISEIRNIIIHPFSYKENKKNYSYWQIDYLKNLNWDEIKLTKMNETNITDQEWIQDVMVFNTFEENKINFLNLIIELLEEMLFYFEKNINNQIFLKEFKKYLDLKNKLFFKSKRNFSN